MTSEEYKQILMGNDVLDYTTLNITVKELTAKKDFKLAEEIQRILRDNKIEKPALHDNLDEAATNYYKVDLSDDNIDEIRDMFSDLEVSFVGEDGDTTPTASFYATLADKWFNVSENLS
jgi:hypothetical protein